MDVSGQHRRLFLPHPWHTDGDTDQDIDTDQYGHVHPHADRHHDRHGDTGGYLICTDRVGAGADETVLILDEGSSARQIYDIPTGPIRSVVVGIVDDVHETVDDWRVAGENAE